MLLDDVFVVTRVAAELSRRRRKLPEPENQRSAMSSDMDEFTTTWYQSANPGGNRARKRSGWLVFTSHVPETFCPTDRGVPTMKTKPAVRTIPPPVPVTWIT